MMNKCKRCHKSFKTWVKYSSPEIERYSRLCRDCSLKPLLTGVNGFIGRRLKEKYNCVGIDKDRFHNLRRYSKSMVFHCGAVTKIRDTIEDPNLCFQWNVNATHRVFEFCRKNDADLIYFSSSRVLADHNNPYTASKVYGEELCKAYNDCYGLKYKVIRPSTVYGPGDKNRLISIFIEKAKKNEPLIIYGNVNKTLDFTYIDDFMQAFDLIYRKGKWNTDYDVGCGERFVLEAAEIIKKELNSESPIYFKPPETAQPQTVGIDYSKLKELGYKPQYPLERGLKETICSVVK